MIRYNFVLINPSFRQGILIIMQLKYYYGRGEAEIEETFQQ
jgi:hypothetical protein